MPEKSTTFAFASFLFDPENQRLTQNGIPVRVNNQILELLALLVRNAGELVTREQIRLSLWPEQEFVNHEKIITNAVSRLRHILRDDPVKPKYIESVPKRGYRLIVHVTLLGGELEDESTPTLLEASTESGGSSLERLPLALEQQVGGRSGLGRRFYLYAALVMLLVVVGFAWRWRVAHRSPAANTQISMGIAPFETSGAGAKELAESFRLDLTDSLAQLPHVNMRAAHSLELFSLDESTFRDRANKLGLDVLLLGRFTLDGDNCHVQLELMRGKDLGHVATFQYTASRDELASLRDKIQMEVFNNLKLARTGEGDAPRAAIGGTSDPRAYDAYLRAGYHLSEQTNDSLRLALKEYEYAISLDPQFAKAYAREARTFFYLQQSSLMSEEEGFRRADEAARHALSLDPTSPDAHAVLGIVYLLRDWNLSAGENELRLAIAQDPNQPFYHQGLALIFCDEGRFREALSEIDLAHANDPFWVSAYVTEAHVASIAKDMPRVSSATRKLMELMPDSPHARDAIGNAEWNTGHYIEAIATWRAMAELEHDADRVSIEDRGLEAFHKGGVPAYARVRLAAIASGKGIQLHENDFVAAEWYGYTGDTESTLQAIRAAIAKHDSAMLGLGVVPAYDSLRKNAEFQKMLPAFGR